MGYYTNGEIDFINRTFEIINQYNSQKLNEEKKYEVTLLINCLFGILILAKNEWLDDIREIKLSEIEEIAKIDYYNEGEKIVKDFGDLIHSMRNGICHWKDEKNAYCKELKGIVFEEKDGKIDKIVIQGTLKWKHVVDITFSTPEDLYNFLLILQTKIK